MASTVCVCVWLCVDVFPKQGDEWNILSLFLKKKNLMHLFQFLFLVQFIIYLHKNDVALKSFIFQVKEEKQLYINSKSKLSQDFEVH